MQALFRDAVSSVSGLLILLLALTAPSRAAEPDARSNLTVIDSAQSHVISQHENFLLDLTNGLIRMGKINHAHLDSTEQLWQNLPHLNLKQATSQHFSNSGGFVFDQSIIPAKLDFQVLFHEGSFIARWPDGKRHLLGKRTDSSRCQLDTFQGPAYAWRTAYDNIQCVYARTLKSLCDLESCVFLSNDILRDELLWSEVEGYASSLVASGHLSSYEIDQDQQSVTLKAFTFSDPIKLYLNSSDVNLYSSPDMEALFLRNDIKRVLKNTFLYVDTDNNVLPIERDELLYALSQVVSDSELKTTDSLSIRTQFFTNIGLGHLVDDASPLQHAEACAYPSEGRATPCNTDVVHLTGYGSTRSIIPKIGRTLPVGYNSLKRALREFGYNIHNITFYTANDSDTTAKNLEKLASLGSSQTWLVDAHGLDDSPFFALSCDLDIEAVDDAGIVTSNCCERVKAFARQLGYDNYESYDCSIPGQRLSVLNGEAGCVLAYPGDCNGKANRCTIALSPQCLAQTAEQTAFVGTIQCYGRRCIQQPDADSVLDFVTQSQWMNYGPSSSCDFDMLAKDLRGESQYCASSRVKHPAQNREPFLGYYNRANCISHAEHRQPNPMSSFVYDLRTAESSRYTRDNISLWENRVQQINEYAAANLGNVTCDGLRSFVNQAGFERDFIWTPYLDLNVGGNPGVAIEFAPTVRGANLVTPDEQLVVQFSSAVTHAEIVVSGTPDTLITEGVVYANSTHSSLEKTFHIEGLNHAFNQVEWENRSTESMEREYGYHQLNWPWYIAVAISAQAPNGIELVGNAGGNGSWLYASPLKESDEPSYIFAPWTFANGILAFGRQTTLRIPLKPRFLCCTPKYEFPCGPDGRLLPPVQVGESCEENITPGQCFREACLSGTTGHPQALSGSTGETLDQSACILGSHRKKYGMPHPWAVSCEDNPHCKQFIYTGSYRELECPSDERALPVERMEQFLDLETGHVKQCAPYEYEPDYCLESSCGQP